MKKIVFLLLIVFFFSNHVMAKKEVIVSSPDKQLRLVFSDALNKGRQLNFAVFYKGNTVILPSGMGFLNGAGETLTSNLSLAGIKKSAVREEWKPVYGASSLIKNWYNQAEVGLKDVKGEIALTITFRAYNEGIAFCYTFPGNGGSMLISKELSGFRFEGDYPAWVATRAQAQYSKIPLSKIGEAAERPLVIEIAGDRYVALGEARLVDFPRMKFIPAPETQNSVVAKLDSEAKIKLPYTTPWRYAMIGDSPGELLENNYFLMNLNDPCALKDVSWIKPGKAIREVTLTTQGGKACVDFAAENGISYVEFDAGWYGPENNDSSDATGVHLDPARSSGPLDLKEVIAYGNSKGIGILLYVNRRALEKQLDVILPLYKSWGVKGVKYGFVQVGSQQWTTWLHEAVKKAAENQLMVDIHDEYRPTGFSRTYPNLMTQEGIRGDEESPSNEHTLITLFTRMVAGAGDNTICYYAPRVTEKMGGHVSQLAKAIMLYSPWQFIYWYDRPQGSPGRKGGAGNSAGFIQSDKELELFRILPTVWDETRVMEGSIGEYATLAKRSGDEWFVGSLTARKPRELALKTNFLEKDSKYMATIYSNDPALATATKVKIEKQVVTSESILKFQIAANSGVAIHLKKMD